MPEERPRPWRERRSWLALTLGLGALWAVLRAVSGFDGLYGQDGHAYLQTAQALQSWAAGGPRPTPLFWPPLYALSVAALGEIVPLVHAAQAVSALAWMAAWGLGARLLTRLHDGAGRLGLVYWTVSFALAPYVVRAALCSMSDLLGIALLLAFLLAALEYERNAAPAQLVAAALALGLALGARQPLALVAAPIVLRLAWLATTRRAIVTLPLAALAGALVLLPSLWLMGGAHAVTAGQYPGLRGWSAANALARRLVSADGVQDYSWPTLAFAFSSVVHPGFLSCGALWLAGARARDLAGGFERALACGHLVFALFMAGVPYQHERHLLASFPLVVLLLFPAARRLVASVATRSLLALALVIATMQLGLAWRALRAPISAQRLERAVAERLRSYPSTTLYAFWLTPALRTRGVPQRLHDLFDGPPPRPSRGELLLFAPERFAEQWRGRGPMRAWERLSRDFALVPREIFELGFTLFELRSAALGATPPTSGGE